jgi:hypothetical protein
MYSIPAAEQAEAPKGQLAGSVDVGVMHQSDSNNYSKREEYSDQRNGVYLNNFTLSSESEGLRYFIINGGGMGRRDQFYDVTTGKYGSWKVRTFYNETLHVFTDTWKSLYDGEGTGNLTLSGPGMTLPTRVSSGTYTAGSANYVGATSTCSPTAPCWSYKDRNGVTNVYSNATALAAINGTLGTYGANGALVAATGSAASTGQKQSNLADAIAVKLAGTPYSELSLVRKKGGVRGDINLTENVKAYASYGLEKRVGSRPFSMNENNMSVEIAEPIDYRTHDFLTGLTYSDDLTQANLRASASIFRNNIDTLVVQYPFMSGVNSGGVIQHATFDLAPNNDAYNLKGEFARSLPDFYKGRLTASASYTTNRQNDALLAPIASAENNDLAGTTYIDNVTSGTSLGLANPGYSANGAKVSNWNTTAALSQSTANQRIDKKTIDLALALNPIDDLNVKGSYRYSGNENKGGYMAYNPLTGQFGRGPIDARGTAIMEVVVAGNTPGGACYVPPGYPALTGTCLFGTGGATTATPNVITSGTNSPVFSPAYSTRQYNFGLQADYALSRTSSLNGAIEREDIHRTFREREKTEENKIKLGYVNRALADTTLRVSLEKDTRRGSDYLFNARSYYVMPNGGQLPGLSLQALNNGANQTTGAAAGYYPAMTGNYNMYSTYFRKTDVADRNQKILNTRLNWMAREDVDVGVNLQVKRVEYTETTYGVKKEDQDSLGLDLTFLPSVESTITAFYSYQNANRSLVENTAVGGGTIGCTPANLLPCSDSSNGINGKRPDSAQYTSKTNDRSNLVGLGLMEDLGFVHLSVDYTYGKSTTHISYDNLGATALNVNAFTQATMLAIAGNALPDMTTIQNTLTLNLVKPLNKKTTVRAMYRFDGMRITDWHYNDVIHNAVAGYDATNTLLLDSGPLNYHVNTLGVFLNYKM